MEQTVVILAKLTFLKIPANAWDAIIPKGGTKVSPALREYLAAGLARDVAARVRDKKIASNVMEIGKEMVQSASGGLIQGWEDGDDICPPWPVPPLPWWQWSGNETQDPEPHPWKSASTEQVVLADVLTSLSEMTSQRELGARLREAASGIIAGLSRSLVKDFQAAA